MRTDLNSGGFMLYEIFFSNTIAGIKTGLLSVSLSSLLDRFAYLNTAVQFKDTLRLAHLLAQNKRKFHRLKSEYRKLPLQRKNSGSYKTVLQEKVPGKISISATSLPSFSVFGFAAGGTITLQTEEYSTKVVVSPIGRIRQTEILRK